MTKGIVYSEPKSSEQKLFNFRRIESLEIVINEYHKGKEIIQRNYNELVEKGCTIHNKKDLEKLGIVI